MVRLSMKTHVCTLKPLPIKTYTVFKKRNLVSFIEQLLNCLVEITIGIPSVFSFKIKPSYDSENKKENIKQIYMLLKQILKQFKEKGKVSKKELKAFEEKLDLSYCIFSYESHQYIASIFFALKQLSDENYKNNSAASTYMKKLIIFRMLRITVIC